jgi:hypothetical protein
MYMLLFQAGKEASAWVAAPVKNQLSYRLRLCFALDIQLGSATTAN